MPLDGHDFLVSQGWTGKGTGLREGAISRPLAIPQKKNLAGLGKDRDEAFPFWDHLFSAAAKSIQLKLSNSDESDEKDASVPEIKRTATGIMSNRRPITGVSASASTSGLNTPEATNYPRLNLLAVAKRDAARSSLYARFFRGPVLGPDEDLLTPTTSSVVCSVPAVEDSPVTEDKTADEGDDDIARKSKKRKRNVDDEAARLQRKKERKEQKAKEKEERRARRREKQKSQETDEQRTPDEDCETDKAREKEERRARRRERRDAREMDVGLEMKRKRRKQVLEEEDEDLTSDMREEQKGKKNKSKTVDAITTELRSEKKLSDDVDLTATDKDVLDHERKKKKKWKREQGLPSSHT
ncbi:hypothetical protein H0H92_015358 [Tricholoma furcatifolium]|nr:hypothetical protein H0H92_015358 [Tricholoma furcatifolium]